MVKIISMKEQLAIPGVIITEKEQYFCFFPVVPDPRTGELKAYINADQCIEWVDGSVARDWHKIEAKARQVIRSVFRLPV